MARINVTGNQVLASVVALLCASLGFDESTCYEVADADQVPAVPIAGDWWCTVAGGDGQFDPGNQDPSQCSEETEVIVTGYTRIMTDRTDHVENLLHDPARGCLYMKGMLLSALVGKDLATTTGDTFLRTFVWAARSSPAQTGEHPETGEFLGRIQVTFRLEFDWQLEQL
ncbi:MAG: hypothetical protein ACLP9L_38930 [Thermoguttaceae bacterium]